MKREFAFSDSLRMLEVLWSSLPADPPETELVLVGRAFVATETQMIGAGAAAMGLGDQQDKLNPDGTPKETVYTKICALRRQNSALSLCSSGASPSQTKSPSPGGHHHRFNQSLDESRLSRSDALRSPPGSGEEKRFVFPPNNDGPGVARRITNPFLSPSSLSPGGSHFKELKERLVKKASGFSASVGGQETIEENDSGEKTPQRVVKSFNEFLNFASAGTKIKWQGRRTESLEKMKDKGEKRNTVENKEEPPEPLDDNSYETSKEGSRRDEEEEEEEESSPDDTQEYFPMTTSITRELRLELESLDRQVFGGVNSRPSDGQGIADDSACGGYRKLQHFSTDETYDDVEVDEKHENKLDQVGAEKQDLDNCGLKAKLDLEKRLSTCSINDVFVWENPLNQFPSSASIGSLSENVEVETVPVQKELPPGLSMFVDPLELSNQMANSSCEEAAEAAALMTSAGNPLNMSIRTPGTLPPPPEFGGGNPFLMFLSLTLLLQHRDYVMRNNLDYNEMAMHFDKMVRKHNVTRTLNQARQMYSDYLASFKGRLGAGGDVGR